MILRRPCRLICTLCARRTVRGAIHRRQDDLAECAGEYAQRKKFRISGQGMPRLRAPETRGDLVCEA